MKRRSRRFASVICTHTDACPKATTLGSTRARSYSLSAAEAWTAAGAYTLQIYFDFAGYSLLASLAKLQHAVVAEVYLRTGELLRPGGRSANSERGLLVFAFERVPSSALVVAAAPRATERPR